ncbi:MAG: hypothetical protein A2Z90_19125 [Burkholderiales bacterium GWA2_64_37]|nr:MAG: hypothetical protein A2Z90_19125 [Burkholderiales bacterium GWA2_64_37]HCE94989.1 hypothetical protein [Acidovorax sp.]
MDEAAYSREWSAVTTEVAELARFASAILNEARTKQSKETVKRAIERVLGFEQSSFSWVEGIESQISYLNSANAFAFQIERASANFAQQVGVELLARARRLRVLIFDLVKVLPEDVTSRLQMDESDTLLSDEGRIQARLARLQDTIQGALDRASDAAKRASSVEDSVSEVAKHVEIKFDQFNQRSEAEFVKLQSEFKTNAASLQALHEDGRRELEEKLKETEQFLGVLASKAIGGGYMRNAIKEERRADLFRLLAVGTMVALGLYLVFSIAFMEMRDIEPQRAVVRLTGVVFFSFVIGYLIRQSAVHRGQQHQYQRTAFDLKAIDPFLADLPEATRHAIKLQLAEKIFVPKEVLASTDSTGFGLHEAILKYLEKNKPVKEKEKGLG